jgi:hypothetical protein
LLWLDISSTPATLKQYNSNTAKWESVSNPSVGFDPVTTVNTDYTASVGELVLANSGINISLPNDPSPGSTVGIKRLNTSNPVKFNSVSPDEFLDGFEISNKFANIMITYDGNNWNFVNDKSGLKSLISRLTNFTKSGDGGFTISATEPYDVAHDNEGAGDAGGIESSYDLQFGSTLSGEIVDVEFRNVDYDNNSSGSNQLGLGVGDISPNQNFRKNGTGLYFATDIAGGSDGLDIIENGSESRYTSYSPDYSVQNNITLRIDDTGTNPSVELFFNGNSQVKVNDVPLKNYNIITTLVNYNTSANSVNVEEIGITNGGV